MSKYTYPSIYSPGEKVTTEQHETEQKILAHERAMVSIDRENARQNSRRNFITGLSVAALAAGGTSMLAGCSNGAASTTVTNNPLLDTLNFALNLEYLEASFYLYTATGSGIPTANQGSNPGMVSGGAAISFTIPEVKNAAMQLAQNELAHVQLLQQTITSLGYSYVAMPTINLAAMGAVTTDALFLAAARQFEGVGVSAYAGGALNLTANTTVLTAASQILHLEAQHAGFLRMLCFQNNVASPAADSLDIAVTPPITQTQVFNTNPTTGFAPSRTTSQVLQIVYGAVGKTGVSSGGFFTNGLNGNIKTT